MQIKTVTKPLRPSERFSNEQAENVTFCAISTPLPLGNNYTLDHLVAALFEVLGFEDFIDLYESVGDRITISYKTAYGYGKEYLNDFDFTCYFKPLYDKL